MKFLRRLGHIYAAAGRLLDFSGSYNHIYLQYRLELPGYLRDRQMFAADRNALQRDMNRAIKRLRKIYG